MIENRVNFQHLPNHSPLGDIKTCPRSKFHLNVHEWKRFAETAKVLVARVLIEFLPKFSFLKKVTPAHIQREYSKEMSNKSFVISMPIIDANEANYGDCVKILRTYEKWIAEMYHEADLLEKHPECDNPPLPGAGCSKGG